MYQTAAKPTGQHLDTVHHQLPEPGYCLPLHFFQQPGTFKVLPPLLLLLTPMLLYLSIMCRLLGRKCCPLQHVRDQQLPGRQQLLLPPLLPTS